MSNLLSEQIVFYSIPCTYNSEISPVTEVLWLIFPDFKDFIYK